jgi:hypothetical protein
MAWPFLIIVAISLTPSPAAAQSIAAGLFKLLTDQTPPPPGYVRDSVAAESTFRTVAGLFTVDLMSLPVATSAGGFAYRFNPTFGTVERISDSFGPFFTERALRSGEGRLSVGFAVQHAGFSSLQGADITGGTFPTNTARFIDQLQPFSVDTLSLTLEADTLTGFASYGVTDRFDVGIVAPVTRLRFSGRRSNTFFGETSLQSVQSGSATGLGDVTLNARYQLLGTGASGVAAGVDLRLPTGREEDLLGAGETAWRVFGAGSWERGIVALHANGGVGIGGVSDERFVAAAATVATGLRISLVGELMFRHISELTSVADVYQAHPVVEGVETMRWLPAETGANTAFLVEPGWQLAVQCPFADPADGRWPAGAIHAVDVLRVRTWVLTRGESERK